MSAANIPQVVYRGDTDAVVAYRHLGADGRPCDITGWAFVLTVHSVENPTSTATQVYQLVADITDPVAGEYEFSVPSVDAEATAPGLYWYDIQATSAPGKDRTIVVGTWTIKQDYTK